MPQGPKRFAVALSRFAHHTCFCHPAMQLVTWRHVAARLCAPPWLGVRCELSWISGYIYRRTHAGSCTSFSLQSQQQGSTGTCNEMSTVRALTTCGTPAAALGLWCCCWPALAGARREGARTGGRRGSGGGIAGGAGRRRRRPGQGRRGRGAAGRVGGAAAGWRPRAQGACFRLCAMLGHSPPWANAMHTLASQPCSPLGCGRSTQVRAGGR